MASIKRTKVKVNLKKSQKFPGLDKSEVVLHAGCGNRDYEMMPNIFNGWEQIRLDIDPDVKPDIVSSIVEMPKVKSGSFDAVYTSHCLEHLYPQDVSKALKEFKRILKPGGFVMIVVPDLQSLGPYIAEGRITQSLYETNYTRLVGQPVTPIDILFGYRPALAQGKVYMAHHTAFTASSLSEILAEAGFLSAVLMRKDFSLLTMAVTQRNAVDRMKKLQSQLSTLSF